VASRSDLGYLTMWFSILALSSSVKLIRGGAVRHRSPYLLNLAGAERSSALSRQQQLQSAELRSAPARSLYGHAMACPCGASTRAGAREERFAGSACAHASTSLSVPPFGGAQGR
jgi:hypothetical protein